MNWAEVILTSLASSVLTMGILGVVVRAIGEGVVQQWLSRSLERFKVDLQLAAFEHQTRFIKLHEKRAKTIGELYRRLVQAQRALRDIRRFRNLGQDVLDKVGVASDATEEFYSYFDERRLYFPKDVCEKVEGAHKEFIALYDLYQEAHISSVMEDHKQLVADLKVECVNDFETTRTGI